MAALAAAGTAEAAGRTVARGDRIEVVRMGISHRGRVEFVSALQVLVKWDDGRSTGLRLDRRVIFRIL